MSDNELLMQTLANLSANIAALNVRLDHFNEDSKNHGERLSRLEERTDKNALGVLGSLAGAGAIGLIQVIDWLKGR